MKAVKLSSPKVDIKRDANYVRASWPAVKDAFWYVVYAKDANGWSYSVQPASDTSVALSAGRKIDSIAVKAVDRLGNESR